MLFLWANAIIAASAGTVWSLWAYTWFRRGNPFLASVYTCASIGTFVFSAGFLLVVVGGDPSASAALSRWMVPIAVGVPAFVRFVELVRDEVRNVRASRMLTSAEDRADKYDAEHSDGR